MKKEPQKTYTVAVLSLLTVMLFGVFAIVPTLKSIFSVREELEKLSALAADLSAKIENIGEARYSFHEATPYKDALESQIYPYEGWGKEVDNIQSLAGANQVKILDLSPGLIIEQEGFLEIGVLGDYSKVKLFLEGLQRAHFNYSLQKLELESSSDESLSNRQKSDFYLSEGEVKAKVLLKVLFYQS